MKARTTNTWKELTIGVQQFIRLLFNNDLSTPDLSFKILSGLNPSFIKYIFKLDPLIIHREILITLLITDQTRLLSVLTVSSSWDRRFGIAYQMS